MEQRTLPLDTTVRRLARAQPRIRPDASDRTIRALIKAIELNLARGYTTPMTIHGDAVLAAGGPSPQHQHGPSISLQAAGKVWTATRQHSRGRVVWAVDLRGDVEPEADLSALIAEVGRVLGREVTAHEAVQYGVSLLRAHRSPAHRMTERTAP